MEINTGSFAALRGEVAGLVTELQKCRQREYALLADVEDLRLALNDAGIRVIGYRGDDAIVPVRRHLRAINGEATR